MHDLSILKQTQLQIINQYVKNVMQQMHVLKLKIYTPLINNYV